jgi:hypothetical protein
MSQTWALLGIAHKNAGLTSTKKGRITMFFGSHKGFEWLSFSWQFVHAETA